MKDDDREFKNNEDERSREAEIFIEKRQMELLQESADRVDFLRRVSLFSGLFMYFLFATNLIHNKGLWDLKNLFTWWCFMVLFFVGDFISFYGKVVIQRRKSEFGVKTREEEDLPWPFAGLRQYRFLIWSLVLNLYLIIILYEPY